MGMMDSVERFKEKLDRWATLYAVLLSIPVVGGLIQKYGKKAGEKVEKRVEKALGLQIEETGKGFGDEILFREALRALDKANQRKIEDFRQWLRENYPKEADAFVLGVAKGIKAFEWQAKKTITSGGKGTREPYARSEYTCFEYDYSWSTNFFERVLERQDDEEKRKFILDGANFKSLIPPKPKPKKKLTPLKKIGKKIADSQESNLNDLESAAKLFRERARQFRQERGR